MPSENLFPSLEGWESTKQTLHLFAKAIGVIPRLHAKPHPRWWHISLKVQPQGLVTDKMLLPRGGDFRLGMDLRQHKVILLVNEVDVHEFSMLDGRTSTEFGEQLIQAVAELGLVGEYERHRFESDDARDYDPKMAETFFKAISNADRIFKRHRASLTGDVGQVQLWPHGFDLSFEWYGTRAETYEEDGVVIEYPAQLNLGLSPGADGAEPYFYSNPWPFEAEKLLDKDLPEGARWHTDSWQGTILPYDELVGDPRAEHRLLNYAKTVYEISAPTLMA